MSKKNDTSISIGTVRQVTCQTAQELSKKPGARIFWRPGSVVNWMLPDLDVAQVLEG